jgi:hypothetical protein
MGIFNMTSINTVVNPMLSAIYLHLDAFPLVDKKSIHL